VRKGPAKRSSCGHWWEMVTTPAEYVWFLEFESPREPIDHETFIKSAEALLARCPVDESGHGKWLREEIERTKRRIAAGSDEEFKRQESARMKQENTEFIDRMRAAGKWPAAWDKQDATK
jgi:hypothetical protein